MTNLKTTEMWRITVAVYEEPVFEEPTLTGRLGKYERVLVPLRETPETWAKIGEYKTNDSAYQAALNLKHGRYKIPGDVADWEFVAEGDKVFAMYTNGVSEDSP